MLTPGSPFEKAVDVRVLEGEFVPGPGANIAQETGGNLEAINGKTVKGIVNAANSTAVALGVGGIFAGLTWMDVSGFASIIVESLSDQASAAGGVVIQWSPNGVDTDGTSILGSALAATFFSQEIAVRAPYARVVYTNGGVIQASFRLTTTLKVNQTQKNPETVLGLTTDTAVTSDAVGSINAHARGLVAILADVWDNVAQRLKTATRLTSNQINEVPNVPSVLPAGNGNWQDDNLTHALNGDVNLIALSRYEILLIPSIPTNTIRGWLCAGNVASEEGGPMIQSGIPYPLCLAVAGKISFMRDALTPFPYKVYVTLKGA